MILKLIEINREQEVMDREQRAGSNEQLTVNREQRAGSNEQVTIKRECERVKIVCRKLFLSFGQYVQEMILAKRKHTPV